MKKPLLFSIICLGATAMASQIVFIREFLIVFSGDELSVGIILAGWMLSGAVGALLLRKLADRIKRKNLVFVLLQIFLSIFLPFGILLIRLIRPILGINPGQILPFHILAFSSIAVLIPLCAVMGFMFILACRIYEIKDKASGIGRVYAMEAFGSILGGGIVSLVLLRYFNSFEIMSVLSLLNAAAAFFFAEAPQKRMARAGAAVIIISLGLVWMLQGWKNAEIFSFKKQWKGYEVLDARNSVYANLVTLKRDGQISFINNGIRFCSVPDKKISEEAVHFCLLEHKDPKNILLIGGGIGGLVDEILKYPVRHIDYVELDPELVRLARSFLARGYTKALDDGRVSIKNMDGRYFIKTTGNKYDCIIIDLGDPYTAQLNRFYTRDFFREAKNVLTDGGIISFGLSGSESYIDPDMSEYLSSVRATLQKEFADVKVIPGNTAYFLASESPGGLTYDYKLLMRRAEERQLDLQYMREDYLFARMSADKVRYTEDALKRSGARINFDFRPSSYYYAIIYWASQFRDSLMTNVLRTASGGIIWSVFALAGIFIMLLGLKNTGNSAKPALAGVFVMGFSQAAIQIMLLFSFQVIYGYLYFKLGMLFTFFMLGLALAGWYESRADAGPGRSKIKFLVVQLSIAVYAFIFPAAVNLISAAKTGYAHWFGAAIFFPALSLLAGLQGGALFALSNRIYLAGKKEAAAGSSAGLTYGLDLLGSCLGAALTGVFMIPVLGLVQSCLAVAFLNLAVVLIFLRSRDIIYK
ncbi:MAG: fused MFS/spermidine synthase [Candidatus Omnitrophica bacterium]|nr:fused MFS/spermidine synthase [Candidatus Omnitrophota bacterium]